MDNENNKSTLVLSGINLFSGGPLSIYYDFLDTIINLNIECKFKVVAFVHKKSLFIDYNNSNIEFIELPNSRKNYIYRVWYEYFYFYRYSKNNKIDIWISLHDITPRVISRLLFTYCHNPTPFMDKKVKKRKYGLKYKVFSYFYKYIYKINIKSATAIIVQQEWLRNEFKKMFNIDKVIVARPRLKLSNIIKTTKVNQNSKTIFVFASFPRYFKNFDIICEACKKYISDKYEVWITLDGTENKYSRYLKKKYSGLENIKWKGILQREEVIKLYEQSNCLIFPSLLETWGLPISEYKATGKPMLIADLPYAHETVGEYDKAVFFNPYDADQLAGYMKLIVNNNMKYTFHKSIKCEMPYAESWKELIEMIIKY